MEDTLERRSLRAKWVIRSRDTPGATAPPSGRASRRDRERYRSHGPRSPPLRSGAQLPLVCWRGSRVFLKDPRLMC